MKASILLVDDEPAIQFGFTKYLSKAGYSVSAVSSIAEAHETFLSNRFDAALIDLNLPDGKGIDLIRELREAYPGIAIVMISGEGDIPLAVEAMRLGADNFLTKPVNMAELEVFLQKSLELGVLRIKDLTHKRLSRRDEFYFGESPAMRGVMELAAVAAENDSPVILAGETGTGKGVLSRWIHHNSSRTGTSFVEVNCSSLRGELLASELFGHAKGAFTTAIQDRQGLIEIADRGTLFLDEIGDMDPGVQAQFLKVIEEKQYRRLGETRMRRSEFRLICATNRDLEGEIRKGRFRQDLFFRIHVFPIHLPPLRERPEDIPGLIQHITRSLVTGQNGLSPQVVQLLQAYQWPGNIRELRNVLERALLLARGAPLGPEHFPGLCSHAPFERVNETVVDLDRQEQEYVTGVLKKFGGDVKKAAEALGVSQRTLYRKLERSRKVGP